jgi:hypothetical protein
MVLDDHAAPPALIMRIVPYVAPVRTSWRSAGHGHAGSTFGPVG